MKTVTLAARPVNWRGFAGWLATAALSWAAGYGLADAIPADRIGTLDPLTRIGVLIGFMFATAAFALSAFVVAVGSVATVYGLCFGEGGSAR